MTKTNGMSEREAIEVIISNFDFVKVHKYMTDTDWRWGCKDKVPTIERLKECATDLLIESIRDKVSAATGGFSVFHIGHGVILIFGIEECAVDFNEV